VVNLSEIVFSKTLQTAPYQGSGLLPSVTQTLGSLPK
jgi:hypothetical protein